MGCHSVFGENKNVICLLDELGLRAIEWATCVPFLRWSVQTVLAWREMLSAPTRHLDLLADGRTPWPVPW